MDGNGKGPMDKAVVLARERQADRRVDRKGTAGSQQLAHGGGGDGGC